VPAGAPAAPGSGRARAPGHALDASLDPTLESTIAAEHEPMRGVIPLPGLAQAALETRRSGARAYLHVFSGKNKGESLLLGDEPVTLGRDPKNALVLKDEGVSQVHAELRLDGARFVLRDLGSRNGTFVNDERVISRQLEGGDVVGLGGETKLLFQAGG
jgi:pSer/pThr/pTyr-binding forkhead associated (FHA) protein